MISNISIAELKDFIYKLGLKPRLHYAKYPHQDISKKTREKALQMGAIPVSSKKLILIVRQIELNKSASVV